MLPAAERHSAGALNPPAGLLPAGFGIRLDAAVRATDSGRTLTGGSPMRRLRLSPTAANILADLCAGAPATTPAARRLGRRLCDAGIAHPQPPPGGPEPGEVTCVVPVRDDAEGLRGLLASLESHPPRPGGLVVVEDGSGDPGAIARCAHRAGADLISRAGARGPAAARNAGWNRTGSGIVAFLDADVEVGPRWLEPLLAHFADPTVAAVAPRVRAVARPRDALGRFERDSSPLDMGAEPSRVAPRLRVPYVPTAALLVRREALESLGGFDEDLRVGEDVDLVWRAVAAGRTVRYEPAVVVHHRNRPSWAALARRRFDYGTSAAALAERHRAAVTPLDTNPLGAVVVAAALAGAKGVLPAAAALAVGAGRLHRRLANHGGVAAPEAARIVLGGALATGGQAAVALRRAWLPLLGVATAWRWGRRLAVASLVLEPLITWVRRRPELGPLRWTAATLLADAAYCAGVWRGVLAKRSAAAVLPRIGHRRSRAPAGPGAEQPRAGAGP